MLENKPKLIVHRVMEGGHDVPISKIVNRYYKSINNASIAASFVDRLYVYDNSLDYAPARLLFRANNGSLEKVYADINTWADVIFNAVSK